MCYSAGAMPLPPAPPPPPCAPPPPTFTPAAPPAGNTEGRNLLLQSIQRGTKLKKTVTNDKSAPLIQGKIHISYLKARFIRLYQHVRVRNYTMFQEMKTLPVIMFLNPLSTI